MQINKQVFGISGVARAGKDTFAAILEMKLQQAGKSVKKIALAEPLKVHCHKFLTDNLGISAYTQITEEKDIIRPMLVWYGDAQRKRTDGRYWIDFAKKTIEESNYDYYIITDVRYDTYEKDELHFLKKEVNGILCHISKYTIVDGEKNFVQPANEHEAYNDPKIKAGAHHTVEWEDERRLNVHQLLLNPALNKPLDLHELLLNPTLNEHVEKFMKIWIQNF